MRGVVSLVLATTILSTTLSSAKDVKQIVPAKQIEIRMVYLEGDPLGSREDGTIRCLAEPLVVTLENQPVIFQSGEKYAVRGVALPLQLGIEVSFTPGTIQQGKVAIDLKASRTIREKTSDDRAELLTTTKRLITTIPLDELQRLRLGEKLGKQTWVEFTLVEIKPIK